MATINYSFTLSNTTGNQLIKLIKCIDNSEVYSTSTTHSNGNISDSLYVPNILVQEGVPYSVRVIDGSTTQTSSCSSLECDTIYYYEVEGCGSGIVPMAILRSNFIIPDGVTIKADNGNCYQILNTTTNTNYVLTASSSSITYNGCLDCNNS